MSFPDRISYQAFSSSPRTAGAYVSSLTPPRSQETLTTYLPSVLSILFKAESRSQQIWSEATKRFPALAQVSPQDAFRRLDLLGYLIAQARPVLYMHNMFILGLYI